MGRGVLLGLVLVVSGIVFLVNALMHREMEAATSPEGLSLSVGDQNSFVRWCDIKEVRQVRNQFDGGGIWSSIYAKSQGKDRVLVVQELAGSTLEFTNFLENLGQLAEIVERATFTHLWPSALQVLAAGQTLDFGQLKLNQTGLWIKPDAPLAWADVAQITSESEHLKIKANGKWLHWFSAPLGTIPNGHVFLQVAEYCRAQPGGVFAASGAPAEFPAPFAGTPSAGNQGAGNANAVWGTTTPATPTSMMSRPMQIITGVFLCFLGLIFISVMISLSKQRNNNAFVITFFMAMGMLAIIGGGWLGIKALLRKS